MQKQVSRAEMKSGVFDPDVADFHLKRTISKQVVDGVMQYKSDTTSGVIVWAEADDSVPDNYKFILGLVAEAKKAIIPIRVQLFKGA